MKRRIATDVDLPSAPVELLRCVVDDWLEPTELAEVRGRPLPIGEVDAEAWFRFNASMRAWRNWQDYRADWLVEHEVSRRDACRVWPLSRPAWRDELDPDPVPRMPRKRVAPVKVGT